MNCSTPGFPVPSLLLELAQTHVHWVSDAIQPFHPLLSPSPPALNLSQHQGLFQWVGSSQQVTKVLELQLQHQFFQWIQGWSPLALTGLVSLMSKGLSRVFSSITVWNHQFLSIQPSVWSKTHVSLYMTIGKAIALTIWTFVDKVMSPLLLSRFVIAFLPRSKCLNFVAAVTIYSDFRA